MLLDRTTDRPIVPFPLAIGSGSTDIRLLYDTPLEEADEELDEELSARLGSY